MKLLGAWLFESNSGLTRREVFRWWEARRLTYNFLVGIIGIATWLSVMIAGSAAVKPGEDFEEPLAMIIGPFVYAFFANLCYSLGPILDLTFFKATPRVKFFKIGLFFSLILTALPGLWAITAWLITVVNGKKL